MSERELAAVGLTRESIAQMLESDQARAWCAMEEHAIVGSSMARRLERDVFALFVLPGFEGRGIGASLLKRAVAWLRQECDQLIRLSIERHTRAHSLYLAWGWREVGEQADGDPILEIRA
jgi:GNAT superfamily N-acetyltransferase